ncbi:MAG: isochorismatase family protein [Gaiellales bacterium]
MEFEGFHGEAGFGVSPALAVIDVNVGFTDPESPLVCDLEGVVEAIGQLLGASRAAGIPIVYTTVAFGEGDKVAAKAFIDKIPALTTLAEGSPWVEIDPRVAPLPTEPVLKKLFASAFFGTPLQALLTANEVDTLIVTGASTSGCVRATVVDAIQHAFRPIVPLEAVGDRNPDAHEANLYDIQAKYGDVVSLEVTLAYLQGLAPAPARAGVEAA